MVDRGGRVWRVCDKDVEVGQGVGLDEGVEIFVFVDDGLETKGF